mmetsp:Transcript_15123/g.34416  ORF Transcript_15123/g.34416 Transcript_15123/m.34416 type:complete len:239 (+) Transcript_15123:869-1585(+)
MSASTGAQQHARGCRDRREAFGRAWQQRSKRTTSYENAKLPHLRYRQPAKGALHAAGAMSEFDHSRPHNEDASLGNLILLEEAMAFRYCDLLEAVEHRINLLGWQPVYVLQAWTVCLQQLQLVCLGTHERIFQQSIEVFFLDREQVTVLFTSNGGISRLLMQQRQLPKDGACWESRDLGAEVSLPHLCQYRHRLLQCCALYALALLCDFHPWWLNGSAALPGHRHSALFPLHLAWTPR